MSNKNSLDIRRLLAQHRRLYWNFFPTRTANVLNQLRAQGVYPTVTAPSFDQHGGAVAAGFAVTMSAPAGTIYFTTNGVDPRQYGSGAVSPQAVAYGGPVPLLASTVVRSGC